MPLAMFDTVPLLSLAVKLMVPADGATIQYFGPMFLAGVALQALFAWLLLREATRDRSGTAYRIALALGALFLATAPALFVRFQLSHMSISQHWPLVAALWLMARSRRVGLGTSLRGYSLLEGVVAAISPYMMVMTLMIYSGFALKCASDRMLRWRNAPLLLIPPLIGSIVLVVSGFIDPFGGKLIPGEGYGFFSANLYTLFDPMPDRFGSALLPGQAVSSAGQYEGFGYLGLGGLLLVAGGIVLARARRDDGDGSFPPLAVVIFAAFLLALSARVSFGIYSFDIRLPQWLFDLLVTFRSSGRFIWVVSYALLFIASAALIRQLAPRRAAALLALAATVQAVDTAAPLAAMHQRFAAIQGAERFTDAAFLGLGKAHDSLAVLPAWQCQQWNSGTHAYPWPSFIRFSNLATDNRLRTNSYYAGRTPLAQSDYHCLRYPASLNAAPARKRTVYLLTASAFARHGAHLARTHWCDAAEGFVLCRSDRPAPGMSPRALAVLAAPAKPRDNAP